MSLLDPRLEPILEYIQKIVKRGGNLYAYTRMFSLCRECGEYNQHRSQELSDLEALGGAPSFTVTLTLCHECAELQRQGIIYRNDKLLYDPLTDLDIQMLNCYAEQYRDRLREEEDAENEEDAEAKSDSESWLKAAVEQGGFGTISCTSICTSDDLDI